jgi:hypothetical protein
VQFEAVSGTALLAVIYCCSTSADSLGFRVLPDATGTVVFRYRLQDDVGNVSNWANVAVTIRPVSDTPAAVNDSVKAIQTLPVTFDPLVNDTGLDRPITLEVVTQPTNGTATVVTDAFGSYLRYTPAGSYQGGDGFRYRLRDLDGQTAEANVTVSVEPTWKISPAKRFVRWGVATPQAWTCNGSGSGAQARLWAREIYRQFRDSFDFLVLLSATGLTCRAGIAGEHVAAKNDVTGIGLGVFDATSDFGSAGRLRGVVWMPGIDSLLNGPALHEFAHNWAQFIHTSGFGPHWGFASGGQLGGFDRATFRDLGNGRYQASSGTRSVFFENANGGNSIPYGDLELYLMGMRPAAGTGDFITATGAAWVDINQGIFSATAIQRRTIDELVAQRGPRSPAYPASPRTFRVLTVVITANELTDAQFNSVDTSVDLFGRPASDGDARRFNFWEATGGEGRLQMENVDLELR